MALGISFVFLLILLCENGSQQSDAFNIVTVNHAKARSASSSAKTLSSMAISYLVTASAESIDNSAHVHAKPVVQHSS